MTSGLVLGLGGLALGAGYLFLLADIRSLTSRAFLVDFSARNGISIEERELRTLQSLVLEWLLNRTAVTILVVLVVLVLLTLVVGWLVAGRALKPIDRITRVADEIQATDLSQRIGAAGNDDELARMAGTFDAMLDRLDGAFRSQRQFLAQTSHDLRTPLSVIRSNLEVVAIDPDAKVADWQASAEISLRAAERMSEMLEDLLAAARLGARASTVASLDLAAVVGHVAEEVTARARTSGVVLTVNAEPAVVHADRTLLIRAMGNLVDNALKVAGGGLMLASGAVDRWGFLAVADRGPGLDPGKGEGGGMGLEIVRRIVADHGGALGTGARVGGGALVAIWLPRVGGAELPPPSIGDLPVL